MRTFQQRLDTTLTEMFGSFYYDVPDDKEQQLYDFYMLAYLKPRHSFDASREKAYQDQGVDIYAGSGVKKAEGFDEENKVDYMLQEVADKLLPALKDNLLAAVFFSICAEVRHVLDSAAATIPVSDDTLDWTSVGGKVVYGIDDIKKHSDVLKFGGRKDLERIFERYVDVYEAAVAGTAFAPHGPHGRRPPITHPDLQNNRFDRRASYRATLKTGASSEDFVTISAHLFSELNWEPAFGGQPWANICNGWLKLNEATTQKQMMIYIDHVYDLQHNTGTVFNKIASYAKDGGYIWLKRALDDKRDMDDPHQLIGKISLPLKKLAIRAIKLKTGKSYEQFLQEKGYVLPHFRKLDEPEYVDPSDYSHTRHVVWYLLFGGNSIQPSLFDQLNAPMLWLATLSKTATEVITGLSWLNKYYAEDWKRDEHGQHWYYAIESAIVPVKQAHSEKGARLLQGILDAFYDVEAREGSGVGVHSASTEYDQLVASILSISGGADGVLKSLEYVIGHLEDDRNIGDVEAYVLHIIGQCAKVARQLDEYEQWLHSQSRQALLDSFSGRLGELHEVLSNKHGSHTADIQVQYATNILDALSKLVRQLKDKS